MLNSKQPTSKSSKVPKPVAGSRQALKPPEVFNRKTQKPQKCQKSPPKKKHTHTKILFNNFGPQAAQGGKQKPTATDALTRLSGCRGSWTHKVKQTTSDRKTVQDVSFKQKAATKFTRTASDCKTLFACPTPVCYKTAPHGQIVGCHATLASASEIALAFLKMARAH